MPYTPDPWLKKHIDDNDVSGLPYALLTLLRENDLADDEVFHAANWCHQMMPEAFQPTSTDIPLPESAKELWTEDYYLTQISFANRNFSLERFLHLVEVRNHLRAQGNELVRRIERNEESSPSKNSEIPSGNPQSSRAHSSKNKSIRKLLLLAAFIGLSIFMFVKL